MTREEAIVHIKDVICENNTIKPNIVVFEQEKEALYMAIKALKQEPIIDKIRAEIEEQKQMECFDSYDEMFAYRTGLENAIDIIDKYKAEQEK